MSSPVIINVKDAKYNAVGDGITNDTAAFAAACADLSSNQGGVLHIPPGIYLVGKQTQASASETGYAYLDKPIIHITGCTQPVVIEGNGAVLIAASNLKFGAFDPVTGNALATTAPYTTAAHAAHAYRMIHLEDNTGGVVVKDLELNGRASLLNLGGQWGTLAGRATHACGVWLKNNQSVLLENLHIHHHGLDGVLVSAPACTQESLRTPVTLRNVRCLSNGRNGLRWEGGNGLTAINCQFNFSGRSVPVSALAAGVLVEPVASAFASQGVFMNCEMVDNVGPAFYSAGTNSTSISLHGCTLIGVSSYAAQPYSPRVHFTDCTLAGQVVKPFAESGTERGRATQFTRCRLTDALTYNGQVYTDPSWYLLDFGNNREGVTLTECQVEAVTAKLGYSNGLMTITDTRMRQTNNTGASNIQAVFVGHNVMETSGSNPLTTSIVVGRLTINNEAAAVYDPLQRVNRVLSKDVDGDKLQYLQYYCDPVSSQIVTGQVKQGDVVYASNPVAGGSVGWICVQGGDSTTSVWKSFGQIAN